jgi:phosphate transporter
MDPPIDWSTWFAVALPVSFISLVLIWFLLIVSYRPSRAPGADLDQDGLVLGGESERDLEIRPIRPTKERFGVKQWWVTGVCVVTIGLWCFEHQLHGVVGDMGVIAILPIVAFFSTGVLKKVR